MGEEKTGKKSAENQEEIQKTLDNQEPFCYNVMYVKRKNILFSKIFIHS